MVKINSGFAKTIAGFLAFLVALCMLVILGLQGLILWLNTDQGGDWMTARINAALNDTGYRLYLDRFSLSGFSGFKAQSFKLSHSDETIVMGKNLSLGINLASIARRHLETSLRATLLTVNNFPLPNGKKQNSNNQPFEINNLYFKTAQLNMRIKALELSEALIDGGLKTTLTLKQNIALKSDRIDIAGYIEQINTRSDYLAYLPQRIDNTLQVHPVRQLLSFESLSMAHENYNARLQGQYGPSNGTINVALSGELINLQMPVNPLENPITVKVDIAGKIDDFTGGATFTTLYQKHPAKITSKINRKKNILSLSDIKGSGPGINIQGEVTYDMNTVLAEGQINAVSPNLQIIRYLAGTPDIAGSATANFMVSVKNGTQAMALSGLLSEVRYKDIEAQAVQIKIDADNVKKPENLKACIELSEVHIASIDIEKANTTITNRGDGYDVVLSGHGYSYNPFSVDAEGYVKNLNSPDITLYKMILKSGNGHVDVSGQIQADKLNVRIEGEKLVMAELPFADLTSVPVNVDSLSGRLTGSMEKPEFNVQYSFQPAIKNQDEASFEGEVLFASNTFSTTLSREVCGIKTLSGKLTLPLVLSLQPFDFKLEEKAVILGHVKVQSDLQTLVEPFLDERYTLKGNLNVDTQVSGTLSAPKLNGVASLDSGLFVDTYNDIRLTDVTANAKLNNQCIELLSLTASDSREKGTLALSGNFDFADANNPEIKATLHVDDMHLLQHENFDAWLNADVTLQTQATGYLISGTLSSKEVSIRIPDRLGNNIPELNIIEQDARKEPADDLFTRTKLDLAFNADNRIFVSGRGLDAELKGLLDIKGTLKTPLIEGDLSTVRGRYEEFGRRFALDRVILRFQGAVPPSPYLDMEASTNVDGTTARILITNSIEDPDIRLASTPSLPEDEILSLILFGEDIQKISPLQAIKLASALRKFSGKGGSAGFDPLYDLKKLTGLDDIYVENVDSEGATVGAGKYISNKLYLEVEQGTEAGSSQASIKVELTPRTSLESKVDQNGENDIGVFWEWKY